MWVSQSTCQGTIQTQVYRRRKIQQCMLRIVRKDNAIDIKIDTFGL